MECLWWTPGGTGEEKATKLIFLSRNDDKVIDEYSDVKKKKETFCVQFFTWVSQQSFQQFLQMYCVHEIAKCSPSLIAIELPSNHDAG